MAIMKTCVLASGSEGNVTYVETENHKILLDLGTTVKYIKEKLPKIKCVKQDATYLMWLDMNEYTDDSGSLAKYIRSKTGLYLSSGAIYRGNGSGFLRMNVACPRSLVEDGLRRLYDALNGYCLDSVYEKGSEAS